MSKEQNKNNNEKEINSKNKENLKLIDIKNTKNKLCPTINMDKDQLFQSFLLFQDFISKNPNIINESKIIETIKKEEVNEVKENISQKNDGIRNNIKLKEEKNDKNKSTSVINNNSSIKLYDEIPIKSTGYNFVELLEKSLANEESIKQKDKTNINSNTKYNKNKIEDSKEIENSKSTNEKTDKPVNVNQIKNEKNITGFINKDINEIKNNNNNDVKNESEIENKNKADFITKEINKINIIKNCENVNNKDEQVKQENKLKNGKEI